VSPIEEAVIVPPTIGKGEDEQPAVIEVVPVVEPVVVEAPVARMDPSSIKDVDLKSIMAKAVAEEQRDASGDLVSAELRLKKAISMPKKTVKQKKASRVAIANARKGVSVAKKALAVVKKAAVKEPTNVELEIKAISEDLELVHNDQLMAISRLVEDDDLLYSLEEVVQVCDGVDGVDADTLHGLYTDMREFKEGWDDSMCNESEMFFGREYRRTRQLVRDYIK